MITEADELTDAEGHENRVVTSVTAQRMRPHLARALAALSGGERDVLWSRNPLSLKGADISLDDLAGLPTDPEALKTWIVQRQGNPADMSLSEQRDEPLFPLITLISELPTPPEARAAAFKALATTPEVRSTGAVEGGQALAIPDPDDHSWEIKLVVDPETAQVKRTNFLLGGDGSVTLPRDSIALATEWTDELPKQGYSAPWANTSPSTPRKAMIFGKPFLAVALAATALGVTPTPPSQPPQPADGVTLITGDRVVIVGRGHRIIPGPGRTEVVFASRTRDGHLHVTPFDAQPLIAKGALDPRLFDVAQLLQWRYGDADTPDIPLITRSENGPAPALGSARGLRRLDGLGMAAFHLPKNGTAQAWKDLAGGRTLAPDTAKIWLDGRRSFSLDRSTTQIGAPEGGGRAFLGLLGRFFGWDFLRFLGRGFGVVVEPDLDPVGDVGRRRCALASDPGSPYRLRVDQHGAEPAYARFRLPPRDRDRPFGHRPDPDDHPRLRHRLIQHPKPLRPGHPEPGPEAFSSVRPRVDSTGCGHPPHEPRSHPKARSATTLATGVHLSPRDTMPEMSNSTEVMNFSPSRR
ncbi:hypothetical protein [Streptosporangium jomthongense]|uniref:Uncharacterized protein n=1 Tax=Streptosporangium jomthongense TaxID=1193683 RepID=A0ABV8EW26_9ACTN